MNVKFRNAFVTLCLGAAAWQASALSLGNVKGQLLLGRPVDLAFDVHTDPGQSLEGACITARLTSGDTPVSGVRVDPLPPAAGHAPAVRVRSSQPMVEPVLTVLLQAGCAGKVSRTYTLLVDLPPSVVPGERPIAIPFTGGMDTAVVARPVATGPAGPKSRRGAARPPDREARAATAGAPVLAPAAPRPASVARKPRPRSEPVRPPVAPQARLVMEPLEAWPEPPSALRLSTTLSLPDAPVSTAQREQAAAQWKALNMAPEDLLKEGARIAAVNEELLQLQARAAQERSTALQQIERLEREKAERYPGTLVFLLGGLLVMAAALATWIAVRLRTVSLQAQDAWAAAVARQPPRTGEPQEPPLESAVEPLEAAAASEAAPSLSETPAQVAPPAQAPALVSVPDPIPTESAALEAAPVPAVQPTLLINPEELFDLQQQAEFFVSVGEHDQAIGVLKKYIANNEASAPNAYLELLRLYRSLSRVDDFNQLRAQFHRHFNGLVPEFASFNRPGRSVLAYPEVLAQIEAIWSDESVLSLLDQILFRTTGSSAERFDLPAYDDLLLLNAIARTTAPSSRGAPPPRPRTTPLSGASDGPEAPPEPDVAQPSVRPGVVNVTDADESMLVYDSSWLLDESLKPAVAAPKRSERVVQPAAGGGVLLDFDLSEPLQGTPEPLPSLTLDDLPPVPPSRSPEPGQPIGFGVNSDRFEARFDLEPRKTE